MTKISCCVGCTPETGRTISDAQGRNCHTYCERYLKEKQEHEKTRKTIDQNKFDDRVYYRYVANRA